MAIFNFRTNLVGKDKDDFNKEVLRVNHLRSRNLSVLLIVISIIVIAITDRPNFYKGIEPVSGPERVLFYLHVSLGMSMLIFLCLSFIKRRFFSEEITWKNKLFNLYFSLAVAVICALFSVNDQLIHGEITIYILGLFIVAIINYLNPITSLFIYLFSYLIFIIGITKFQTNEIILRAHYGNSAILIIIAWFMSNILYYSKVKEFVDRKTIDEQKDQLARANVELTATNFALRESLAALDESQNMIFSLALALESKDHYTRGHSERVAEYAVALADYLGLTEEDKKSLWRAAILHDIGKIGIPDAILNKSSRLSQEEWQIMKSHPERGEVICSKLKFAQEILPIIRHHHERYDGTGYPDALRGEDIPYLARIVAIADMFDAVTSERPYRSVQPLDVALRELERNAGTQFDSLLAKAFVEMHLHKKP